MDNLPVYGGYDDVDRKRKKIRRVSINMIKIQRMTLILQIMIYMKNHNLPFRHDWFLSVQVK